jgi:nicotinamide mononucleotide transporter
MLEIVAAILCLINVFLIVRRVIWAFPIGILGVVLYAFVFYEAKFYGDMVLQIVYIVMQIQGWYAWSQGDRAEDAKIAVRRLDTRQWLITAGLIALGTMSIGRILFSFTNASLPWIDALTTSISLTAQWWMNLRYLENWLLWIVVNVIYLYQYSYKELYVTTALYATFLVLAVLGYREWKQRLIFAEK